MVLIRNSRLCYCTDFHLIKTRLGRERENEIERDREAVIKKTSNGKTHVI